MIRFPAEWHPQRALLLTWPHAATDWVTQLAAIEALYLELTALVCRHQTALIVCRDALHREAVAARLTEAGVPRERLRFALAPSNDTWIRDYGPLTVLANGKPRLIDFRFNGWGGKFLATLDDRVGARLHAAGTFVNGEWQRSELVLEGGAIDTDGHGTALVVRRTLLDPARNPGWCEADIERELSRTLGIRRLLWLDHGWLSGDDTDGHIDTLARFVDAETICHAWCEDPSDADYPGLEQMVAELRALRRADGLPYRLLPLPQPAPLYDPVDGRRLPAGYVNFILLNDAVVIPRFDDPADALVQERLAAAFPGRVIYALDARPALRQGGGLHCLCMQLPHELMLA